MWGLLLAFYVRELTPDESNQSRCGAVDYIVFATDPSGLHVQRFFVRRILIFQGEKFIDGRTAHLFGGRFMTNVGKFQQIEIVKS